MIQEYIKKRKAELEKLTEKFLTDNGHDEICVRQDELNKLMNELEEYTLEYTFLDKIIIQLKKLVMQKTADIEEMQKLLGIQKTEIEQLKEQIKAPHKCAGCDTIIYYKSYCDNCQRLWES